MIQDNTVIHLLESAMQAEGLRQRAIASNVANMNTEGYRRIDVNFEMELKKAMGKGEDINPDKIKMEFYQPQNTPINEHGSDVSLDTELGKMVENSLRHRAYMSLLKKKYQQMDSAIKLQY